MSRVRALGRGRFAFSVSDATYGSMTSTSSDVLVPFPGSSIRTVGPTNQGMALLQLSMNAPGNGKSMTIRLRRDGVTIVSESPTGFGDITSGAQFDVRFPIPAYGRGALYEMWWQGINAGSSYSASRSILIPTDDSRLETREVSERVSVLTQVRIGFPAAQDILRVRTTGPTRGGSGRLVWSIYAAGISKYPTVMRLYRGSTVLYDSGNINPGDVASGMAYDSGVVVIPPWSQPATYSWVGQYPGQAWTFAADTNVSFYVSSGSISVPPVGNR